MSLFIRKRLDARRYSSAAVCLSLAAALWPSLGAPANAEGPTEGLDLVVLVDESGSLRQEGVQAEVAAVVSLVSRGELRNARGPVQVAIVGFGSGADAADVKCPLQEIANDNLQSFIECAGRIRLRTSARNNNTDFAAALNAARFIFEGSMQPSNSRAVILMTDGKYDPAGKRSERGTTPEETAALEAASLSMADGKIQVWPLGFGSVEIDELESLASNGSSASCPAGSPQPTARVGEIEGLGNYLIEILGAIFCQKNTQGVLPQSLNVHPLVDQLTLTVRGVMIDPTVITGTGESKCSGDWLIAADGARTCRVEVGGSDAGTWVVAASEDEAVPGEAQLDTSTQGSISLRLVGCSSGSPVVEVSRVDGSEIEWGSLDGISWPQARVTRGNSATQLLLDSASVSVPLSELNDPSGEISVSLAASQEEFVWLIAAADSCELQVSTTSTTGVEPTSLPPPDTAAPSDDQTDDDEGSGFPVLALILFALLLVGGALTVWRIRIRHRRFDRGTTLNQVVSSVRGREVWQERIDLGGLEEVGLRIDQAGWISEEDAEAATYVLRKSRDSSQQDFVIIRRSTGDSNEGSETYHVFSLDVSLGGSRFRVEPPEEDDDDSDDFE